LFDANGGQLAYRQTGFKTIPAGLRWGLLNLGNHLRLYVEKGSQSAAAAEIGVCIAEAVLGRDILRDAAEIGFAADAAGSIAGSVAGGRLPRRRTGLRALAGSSAAPVRIVRRWANPNLLVVHDTPTPPSTRSTHGSAGAR